MERIYYRLLFTMYGGALVVCGACRIYLKLRLTDPQTGFYTAESPWITVLSTVLGAVIVLSLLINRLKKTGNDYPVVREGQGIGLLTIMSGLAQALFTLEQTGWMVITRHQGTMLTDKGRLLCGILGVLSAAAFLLCGVRTLLTHNQRTNGLLLLMPALWSAAQAILKFNSYITVVTNFDNLLLILFTVGSTMFLMGNSRTICGFARKNGRNYTLPTGLLVSLLGLLIVIPNLLYRLLNGGAMPVDAMGDMECLYITVFSFYTLASSVRLRRSIALV